MAWEWSRAMQEMLAGQAAEVSSVISAVALEYYTQAAPAAAAGRLARLHQKAWEAVIAGDSADQQFAELRRQAFALVDAQELIEVCDQHIVWALTPVIAASLACGPGHERISLREVGGALWRMLQTFAAEPSAVQVAA